MCNSHSHKKTLYQATSDDSQATYTWTVATLPFPVVSEEYHTSFFKAQSGYEITCSADSSTYGSDSVTLTIDAEYGTYKSSANENGIFSYSDMAISMTELNTDSDGRYIYSYQAISAFIKSDKSIDLQAVWSLYDDTDSLILTSSNALPGKLFHVNFSEQAEWFS